MRPAASRAVTAAAFVVTAALAAGLWTTDLWPPNETRVAEIAREMPAGEPLVPRLNGRPFLEEPPLFYWLQAAAYGMAGTPSATAARVPAAIGAILCVLVAAALARAAGASAALAAIVIATAPELWWMARAGTPDTLNAAATGMALVAFLRAHRSGSGRALAAAVAAAVVAFWTKSFLGVGLALLVCGAFVAVAGRGALSFRRLGAALGAVAAGSAVWLLVLATGTGASGLSFFLLQNHVGRLVGGAAVGHVRSLAYYVPNLALDLLPWSLALPAAVVVASRRVDRALLFALVWAAAMTVALSVSATKTAHYLLPAYPAFAVLVASWWPGTRSGLDRATRAALAVLLVVGVPVALVVIVSLDARAAMDATGARASAVVAAIRAPTATATAASALAVALGAAFVAASRAGRGDLAAVAAAASATVVHGAIVFAVLPRFDAFVTARPLGEALGRASRDGVPLVAYGFANRERLSALMFYAGAPVREVERAEDVDRLLASGRACVLAPADAHAALAGAARSRVRVGGLRLVLVSGAGGGCPGAGSHPDEGREPATIDVGPSDN
jgi:4-amino-4-deoxy-L-arabinose transferase-like glycosyltransferase